jgi:hypothetical protein
LGDCNFLGIIPRSQRHCSKKMQKIKCFVKLNALFCGVINVYKIAQDLFATH